MSSTRIDRVTEFSHRIEAISERVVEALQRVDARLADLVAIEARELGMPIDGAQQGTQPLAPVLHLPVPSVRPLPTHALMVATQRPSSVAPTAVALAAGAVALVAGVMLLRARRR